MKFLPYIFLFFILAIGALCLISQPTKVKALDYEYEYLRIHILANSNDVSDQMIKFKIKNKIVDFLTPYLSECDSKQQAKEMIEDNLEIIDLIVETTLKNENFNYDAKTELNKEYFPTRYYENCVLEEGEYDSLIISLGKAEGDNWWCVVYPPLCFVNNSLTEEQDIVYQSKLLNIIKKFFD